MTKKNPLSDEKNPPQNFLPPRKSNGHPLLPYIMKQSKETNNKAFYDVQHRKIYYVLKTPPPQKKK